MAATENLNMEPVGNFQTSGPNDDVTLPEWVYDPKVRATHGAPDPALPPYLNTDRLVVYGDRGYDPLMARLILITPLEPCIVRRNEVVGINGISFFVKGPDNRLPMQSVMLPYAIAEWLNNRDRCEQEAHDEWRERTDVSLGGVLTTRVWS